jgi:molybdopterin synthase catalytic subunit
MIQVQHSDFDLQEEIHKLTQKRTDIGAIASFIGLVRDFNGDDKKQSKISSLYLEHYPAMTQKMLQKIANQACEKWQLSAYSIIHRIGELKPAENIVLVICCAPKRINALQACEFIIHSLKVAAPFWKKETYQDGTHRWVEQQAIDKQLAQSFSS